MKVGDKVRIKSWDELVKEFGLDEQDNNKINNKLGMKLTKQLYEIVMLDGEIQKVAEADAEWCILNDAIYGFGANKNMLVKVKGD